LIVSVGGAGVREAKKKLWAYLLKGIAVPKISNSAKLLRGDLIVRPADEATYKALKSIEDRGWLVKRKRPGSPQSSFMMWTGLSSRKSTRV